jgi:hypothetical protein
MGGIDGVILQGRRLADHDQPPHRQGLLADLGPGHGVCDGTARSFAAGDDLAPDLRPAAIRSGNRQHGPVRPFMHLVNRVPEPDLAPTGHQRFGQALH